MSLRVQGVGAASTGRSSEIKKDEKDKTIQDLRDRILSKAKTDFEIIGKKSSLIKERLKCPKLKTRDFNLRTGLERLYLDQVARISARALEGLGGHARKEEDGEAGNGVTEKLPKEVRDGKVVIEKWRQIKEGNKEALTTTLTSLRDQNTYLVTALEANNVNYRDEIKNANKRLEGLGSYDHEVMKVTKELFDRDNPAAGGFDNLENDFHDPSGNYAMYNDQIVPTEKRAIEVVKSRIQGNLDLYEGKIKTAEEDIKKAEEAITEINEKGGAISETPSIRSNKKTYSDASIEKTKDKIKLLNTKREKLEEREVILGLCREQAFKNIGQQVTSFLEDWVSLASGRTDSEIFLTREDQEAEENEKLFELRDLGGLGKGFTYSTKIGNYGEPLS